MNKLTKIDLPYNAIGSFKRADPFATVWVHTPTDDFIVTGGMNQIRQVILAKLEMCFYTYSYWYRGKPRGGFHLEHPYYNMRYVYKGMEDYYHAKTGHYVIVVPRTTKVIASYRRLPSKYPKILMELDAA